MAIPNPAGVTGTGDACSGGGCRRRGDEAAHREPQERQDDQEGEEALDANASPDADVVRHGQHEDQDHRDQLPGRNREGPDVREDSRGRQPWKEHREVRREPDRHGGIRPGLYDPVGHPHVEERRQFAEGLSEVEIHPAGAREHGPHLRVDEAADDGEETADDPGGQDRPLRRQGLRDRGGREEDAAAEHEPQNHERRVPEIQAADELRAAGLVPLDCGGRAHATA